MKHALSLIIVAFLLVACNTDSNRLSVAIDYDESIPQLQFAVEELQKIGTACGLDFQNSEPEMIIRFETNPSLGKETYTIVRDGKTITAKGSDANGLMYAGLELAEVIQDGTKLTRLETISGKPYMPYRGIKFNFPLDARTPSYDDTGDAAQKNITTMWDFEFWQNYLDNMARYRYNLLTLWSLHPYPSMVKVPGYEDVALDDVCIYTKPITYKINKDWDNIDDDIQDPENLKVVIKMTIDEKIAFWQKVFKYAEDRGIDIHLYHWNVYVTGAEGKYGIKWSQDSWETVNYTRASVKQFLLTYPNVKGIGVTAGEYIIRQLKGDLATENWMWQTFGKGIKEAQEINPAIRPRFIFRQHQTNIERMTAPFKEYGEPIDTEFKYSRARMFSSTTPPWFNRIFRKPVEEAGIKIWMNVRNDDILTFRWGDPEYAKAYIKFMPRELMAGYFWGPDGYIYAHDFNSKNADQLPKYEIDKQWYHFMIYGRTGYNPDLPESFYVNRIKAHFPEVNAKKLYDTWKNTSDVISWVDKIHFRQNDLDWIAEGCFDVREFHNINMFCRIPCMPEQGVSSIGDYVINGKKEGELTPFEVAGKLETASKNLLKGASEIKSKGNRELEQTLGDLTALGYLAEYYAHKIKAATHLSLFRLNGTEKDQATAIDELEKALVSWKDYAKTANTYYYPQLLARTQMLDWDEIAKHVAQDIDIARNAKQGEPVEVMGSNVLWEKDMTGH